MRILFAATPGIAVPTLRALAASGHSVSVLTTMPAPTGRGGRLLPSEIDREATGLGLECVRAEKLDGGVRSLLEGRFDLLVSFAFGKIFGPKFLGLFPRGGLNVHPSLLPRWRGPSPLAAAIRACDSQTGLSLQWLDLEMDKGDLLFQTHRPLEGTETTALLTLWAAEAAPGALLPVLAALESGKATSWRQEESLATYCSLIQKTDGRLDWSRGARELDALVRASNPWPGATTFWNRHPLTFWDSRHCLETTEDAKHPPGTVLRLDKSTGLLIKTGDGLLVARELQLPARKSLDYRSFLNGSPGLIGSLLGDAS